MKPRPLGCLTGAGLLAALLTVVVIAALLALRGGRMFSPGDLNAQVGTVRLGGIASHADSGGDCLLCHTAPWSRIPMTQRCLDCHTAIAADLQMPDTLHGVLQTQQTDMACRGCHTEHQGATAHLTVATLVDFPHEATGFSLAAHTAMADGNSLACKACHGESVADARAAVASCESCHQQDDAAFMTAHLSEFGADCLSCHDGLDRFGAAHFDHSVLMFRLVGTHQDTACAACHSSARALPDFAAAPTDCLGCHAADDAHDGEFGTDCAACHTPTRWQDATFDHALTGFPLSGSHLSAACTQCHVNQVYAGTPKTCVACHAADDAHDGQFGTDCAACHMPTRWQDATFDHALTGFPLSGSHLSVACTQCHVNQVYAGTPKTCVACHAADDAHDGQFGTDCAACHMPTRWQDATFDHALTGFPLSGSHLSVACTQCHVNQVYVGTPKTCVACHAADDAHDGQFGTDCAACHTPTRWQDATFDHALTGFPLSGSHLSVACTQCHVNQVYVGTPKTCVACHAADDAHDGEFGTDCAACHTPTRWQDATFDHALTGFPLSGSHLSVACTQCHVNQVYAGTPTDCASCHSEPDFHRGIFDLTCSSCHNTAAWRPALFNNPHPFPMTHGGAATCRTCHVAQVSVYTCTTCHDPQEIEEEHREEGINDFQNCMACHPAGEEDDD